MCRSSRSRPGCGLSVVVKGNRTINLCISFKWRPLMFHPFGPFFFFFPRLQFFFSFLFFVGVQFSTVHPVHNLKRSKLNRLRGRLLVLFTAWDTGWKKKKMVTSRIIKFHECCVFFFPHHVIGFIRCSKNKGWNKEKKNFNDSTRYKKDRKEKRHTENEVFFIIPVKSLFFLCYAYISTLSSTHSSPT